MVTVNWSSVIHAAFPITKLSISKVGVSGSKFEVLLNPTDYTITRNAMYAEVEGIDRNAASLQFVRGTSRVLTMNLLFDTVNPEIGGNGVSSMVTMGISGLMPSYLSKDVREYTQKVFDLMDIDPSLHVPPLLKLEWSSLQFEGFLTNCAEKFTMFSYKGTPVRAVLTCTFTEYVQPSSGKGYAKQSPDTSKYKTVSQGDSLWAIANEEYGDSAQWRVIADANGIENPRTLESGKTLSLPALL